MIETLREAIPEKEPWEKRRQAVFFYEVARKFLTKTDWHKAEPTEEDMIKFIKEASEETPHLMAILKARAEVASKKEFSYELGLSEGTWKAVSIEDFKRAEQVLRERYLAIDQDPAQNRAFLDPILFPEE